MLPRYGFIASRYCLVISYVTSIVSIQKNAIFFLKLPFFFLQVKNHVFFSFHGFMSWQWEVTYVLLYDQMLTQFLTVLKLTAYQKEIYVITDRNHNILAKLEMCYLISANHLLDCLLWYFWQRSVFTTKCDFIVLSQVSEISLTINQFY